MTDARVVSGKPAQVTAIRADSRAVESGALFVAVPGFETDGHHYLQDVLQRGATALLVQEDRRALWEPLVGSEDIVIVAVPDARRALAQAAAGFFGTPAASLGVVGVTGTDGQTTVVHRVAHV
ncbi:MAG: Mur ligase domain-containing protein, partial [Dehalococcoidia bacterium]